MERQVVHKRTTCGPFELRVWSGEYVQLSVKLGSPYGCPVLMAAVSADRERGVFFHCVAGHPLWSRTPSSAGAQ